LLKRDFEKVINLDEFLNYKFKNIGYLENALRHSSYAHECRGKVEDNERLEFLGDAVLEFSISSYIYRNFKELPEGELTKLRASIVCEATLARIARKLNLGKYIKLGKGEANTGGNERDSILSDAMEAVFGAIYLDGGIETAEKFIVDNMESEIKELRVTFAHSDKKTYLQECIQKVSKVPLEYKIVSEEGPAHNKRFVVRVIHQNRILGCGNGRSKKEAEQKAAADAIKKMNKE
jgi:ribonuclease-3